METQEKKKSHAWELTNLSKGTSCWVRVGIHLKYNLDGTINRYKAIVLGKGLTQSYDVDYFETFSLAAKLNSIQVI